jgi:hypothetical protein
MSSQSSTPRALRSLPARPNLEHLRNEAKQRHKELQESVALTQLSDAQLLVARDYGFKSWRDLKADVDRRTLEAKSTPGVDLFDNYVGFYRYNWDVVKNSVVSITRDGDGLYFQSTGGPRFQLLQDAAGAFTLPGMTDRYTFEVDSSGRAYALLITYDRGDVRLARTDAEQAAAAEQASKAALQEQSEPRTEREIGASVTDRYVGFYSTRLGPPIEISVEGGRLFLQVTGQRKIEMSPEDEAKFFSRHIPVQVSFISEAGSVTALVVHQHGREVRMTRVSADEARRTGAFIAEKVEAQAKPRTAVQIDPAVLERYVGLYSMSFGIRLTVTTRDGRLFIQVSGQDPFEVFPESETQFFWTVVAAQISFVAENGRACGAIIHQSGRDIPLTRVESSDLADVQAA